MKGSMLLLLLALVAVASSSSIESLFSRILKKRTSPPRVGCTQDGVDYGPGDEVPSHDSCNSCFCAGPGIICTLMACIETCEQDGQTYYDGDSVPSGDSCNSCGCSGRGGIICTMMACMETCEQDGQTYYEGDSVPSGDSCNICGCSGRGGIICTMMACPDVSTCEHEGQLYNEGDEVPSGDCNTCFCAGHAGLMCTMMACPSPALCVYNGHTYHEGESFTAADGCNKCFCSGTMAACTLMLCPEENDLNKRTSEPVESCQVDRVDYPSGAEVPSEDCNRCWCYDGDLMCTLMACTQDLQEPSKQKRTSPPIEGCRQDGVDYRPGDAVPSGDCNTCACMGRAIGCTLMACPEIHTCEHGGNTYHQGQEVPSGDCNRCYCAGPAGLMCTMMACPEPALCVYNGHTYHEGEDFLAADGCNHCFCSGTIAACTAMFCPEDSDKPKRTSEPEKLCQVGDVSYNSGDSVPSDDCNRCYCMNGYVGCTLMGCAVIPELLPEPDTPAKKRTSPPKPLCTYNDNTYYQGATFPSIDGCNQCFCSGPAVGCTLLPCPDKNQKRTSPPRPYCRYNGETYVEGEAFESMDGCNTCFCGGQDLIACTEMFCIAQDPKSRAAASKRTSDPKEPCISDGKTYQSGESWAAIDGCNSCFCWDGSTGCSYRFCLTNSVDE